MSSAERQEHVRRVRFDPEVIVRKIMLRRLLARRAAPKTDKENVESTTLGNNDMNEKEKSSSVEKPREKVEICYKVKFNSNNKYDENKLIIEDVARKQQLINAEENTEEVAANTKNTDNNKEIDAHEESEEEKEKKDEEKETTAEEVESSSESLPESEVESNAESCNSEFRFDDGDEKDSGIEKGESPNLLQQDINEEQETETRPQESEARKEESPNEVLISVLKKSKLPVKTTLQVMSPANTRTRRSANRGKSAFRLAKENLGFDSEQSYDNSPEKRQRGRKNMTVSYLSYPQRFVRSSLAVEARLSQWRKETSVVEGNRECTARRRMTKENPPQNAIRNSTLQRNAQLKAELLLATGYRRRFEDVSVKILAEKVPGKNVNFTDRRLSESSDSSGDEVAKRMSVRKIYSSKKALRKRIDNLEGILLSMAIQKEGLENLVFILKTWSNELSAVERTKLGVPYIRSVKQVLKKQQQNLNNKKSEFSQLMALLNKSKVPCFNDVTKMIKQLNKDVMSIVQDRKKYSSRHVEDIRQVQGKIIGTCRAITAVYYEE